MTKINEKQKESIRRMMDAIGDTRDVDGVIATFDNARMPADWVEGWVFDKHGDRYFIGVDPSGLTGMKGDKTPEMKPDSGMTLMREKDAQKITDMALIALLAKLLIERGEESAKPDDLTDEQTDAKQIQMLKEYDGPTH